MEDEYEVSDFWLGESESQFDFEKEILIEYCIGIPITRNYDGSISVRLNNVE